MKKDNVFIAKEYGLNGFIGRVKKVEDGVIIAHNNMCFLPKEITYPTIIQLINYLNG